MKKNFLSPFFTPIFFLVTWGIILAIVFTFFPEKRFEITVDGSIIDISTYCGYAILLCGMLYFFKDFKENQRLNWFIFFLLSVCALLREAGIQHHLSSTDTTPFKSRFFLNPNNPLSEKILYGLVLIVFFSMIVYLVVKYAKHLIVSFFKLNTITWSTAVLCCCLVFSKIIDRFPANYRHTHNIPLSRSAIDTCSFLEESSEIFIPIIAFIILWQNHFLIKRN